jgi:hypothetical protein
MPGFRVTLPATRAPRRASSEPRRIGTRAYEMIDLEEQRPRTNLVPILANLNNALSGYIQTV